MTAPMVSVVVPTRDRPEALATNREASAAQLGGPTLAPRATTDVPSAKRP